MNTLPFPPDARWIWHPGGESPNQHIGFVCDFALRTVPKHATLRVAVDSDYQLRVNGVEVPGRQFPCYPHDRVFDSHAIAGLLKKGRNRIALLAYFRGVDGFDYRLGQAGLLVAIEARGRAIGSNSQWLCRRDPVFRSGDAPRTTLQLGFTVEADARREDAWWKPGFRLAKEAGWVAARELAAPVGGYWKSLKPRPLPVDARMQPHAAVLIARGDLLRPAAGDVMSSSNASRFTLPEQDDPNAPPSTAQTMVQDFRRTTRVPQPAPGPWRFDLTGENGRGAFALFDMGCDQFGEFRTVLEAPAGTVLEIAHGEHLDDLGVRAFVGGRNFADRFVCREGLNELAIPFRRIGARYLEVHIFPASNLAATITIHQIGVLPREYPGPLRAGFECDDSLLGALRRVSERTLRLGMSEHFSDCPWREQGLYSYDSRNSALFNYHTFGDYDFAAESIRLLGQGQRADGLLELCAPARASVTIPTFSLVWILSLRDHFLFSGQARLFREYEPVARRILEVFVDRTDERTGLCRLFDGDEYWAFYEWAPGLDFKNGESFGDDGKFRLDAPHNLYLLEAMEAFADLLEFDGREGEAAPWRKRARALRRAAARFFWNKETGLFATFGDRRRRWHFSATTQALAIVTGVASPARRTALQRVLFSPSAPSSRSRENLIPMTLSTHLHGLRALRGAPESSAITARNELARVYGGMLLQGATTLWETERGADDFDLAGSLCHSWSAVPLWFTQAFLLGIEPAAPGFTKFRVRPNPSGLPRASGFLPTPRGPLHVSWQREGSRLTSKISAPTGLQQVA